MIAFERYRNSKYVSRHVFKRVSHDERLTTQKKADYYDTHTHTVKTKKP